MNAKSIMPIWQPIGQSTNLISQKIGEHFGVITSHTGTLDPMAEGVIIVLLGEERLKKYEYAYWQKTYTFDLVFGVETDTGDGLGVIKRTDPAYAEASAGRQVRPINVVKLNQTLGALIGGYTQEIPRYSAKLYKGKKLLEHARASLATPTFHKSGEIYKLELVKFEEVLFSEFIVDLKARINLVQGDFRQEEIRFVWEKFGKGLSGLPAGRQGLLPLQIATCEVEMSKGLYVRSLAMDIAKALGTVGFADRIVRTKNGVYSKYDAKILNTVFPE